MREMRLCADAALISMFVRMCVCMHMYMQNWLHVVNCLYCGWFCLQPSYQLINMYMCIYTHIHTYVLHKYSSVTLIIT